MKNYKIILSQIFYFYIPILLCVLIVLFVLITGVKSNLIFVSVLLLFCLIYIIIFTILNWKTPEVFFESILWSEDAGAAWQREKIKKIQAICLKIDKKLKTIFKK